MFSTTGESSRNVRCDPNNGLNLWSADVCALQPRSLNWPLERSMWRNIAMGVNRPKADRRAR